MNREPSMGEKSMFVSKRFVVLVAAVAALSAPGLASAQVGEPMGSFDITVRQGGNIVVQDTVSIGAGGELEDIKASFQDGDPEDFTQIGTVGGDTPVILKVTTDGDSSFRVAHFYIDAVASLLDINSPGATSLFLPNGGDIDVTVSNWSFDNNAAAIPLLLDSPSFYTSFMRDKSGHFYESAQSNPFNFAGFGVNDIQVPGNAFLDGDLSQYTFAVNQTGTLSSWTWGDILNPGLNTTVHNGFASGVVPIDSGYVFELGMAVAFVQVPEPATLTLLAGGLVPMLRRRRRR